MDDKKFVKEKYLLGKIKLTSPSDTVSQAYVVNARDELKAAKIMIQQGLYTQSIGHSYYAMYLFLQALFYKCGIKSEDHITSIILLSKIFEKNNKEIKKAKKMRVDSQYYTNISISDRNCQKLLEVAEHFSLDIDNFISSLTNSQIKMYNDKFNIFVGNTT